MSTWTDGAEPLAGPPPSLPSLPEPPASGSAELRALLLQQESLRAVIESISSQLELRPLLTEIVRHACELIGADNGSIGLFDERRNVIRTEAVYRMPAGELGAEMAPGEGIAGQVLLTGEPLLLRRYGDVPQPTLPELAENPVLGLPVRWQGRMVGFFGIGKTATRYRGRLRRPPPFTERDVETLAVYARHAAIAIENARRYEWEQRRTERLRLIARIGQIITGDLRLTELLQHAADSIHELLGYPNVAIPLLLPEDPHTLVLSTVGGHYKDLVQGEYRLPLTQGIMGAAARTRQVLLVNEVEADPRYVPTPGAVGIRAELAVPIRHGERVLGVLNVESPAHFTDEDAASLEIVADQLAVAIENARLYEQAQELAVLQERQRLARDLHDSVTQLIFGVTLIAQSLVPAWQGDAREGERRAARILELSRSALAEMRALLAELRPHASPGGAALAGTALSGGARVRRDGLPAALQALVREAAADGLRITLDAHGYQARPVPEEEALYRIGQEALHNVVKHARAKHVSIRLFAEGGDTHLVVADDGVGIAAAALSAASPAAQPAPGSMGLHTMAERAQALGGRLEIHSRPGTGTRVEALLPGHRSAE